MDAMRLGVRERERAGVASVLGPPPLFPVPGPKACVRAGGLLATRGPMMTEPPQAVGGRLAEGWAPGLVEPGGAVAICRRYREEDARLMRAVNGVWGSEPSPGLCRFLRQECSRLGLAQQEALDAPSDRLVAYVLLYGEGVLCGNHTLVEVELLAGAVVAAKEREHSVQHVPDFVNLVGLVHGLVRLINQVQEAPEGDKAVAFCDFLETSLSWLMWSVIFWGPTWSPSEIVGHGAARWLGWLMWSVIFWGPTWSPWNCMFGLWFFSGSFSGGGSPC